MFCRVVVVVVVVVVVCACVYTCVDGWLKAKVKGVPVCVSIL